MNTIKPTALKNLKSFVALDATWYMPNSGKDGYQEFLKERLPDARFFDLDAVKSSSPYPHMMPPKSIFDEAMSNLGVNPSDTIVVYDKGNMFSSPRVYWMLKEFGLENVAVLDNYADYANKFKLETSPPKKFPIESFNSPSTGKWVEFEEMCKLAKDPNIVVIDARPAPRFFGQAPEPRPQLPNGHIPGAISLPATEVLEDGHYKPSEEIKQLLEERKVDTSKQIVCMCGSGVTACIVKYAIDPFLEKPASIYDGSWTEWAQRSDYIEDSSS